MSELTALINKRQKELDALVETLGTDFPIVEDNKRRRIAYLEMLIEDLRNLRDKQPTLNDNQQIVLEYLKKQFGKYEFFKKSIFAPIQEWLLDCWDYEVDAAFEQLDLKQEIQILEVFGQWALEQEGE